AMAVVRGSSDVEILDVDAWRDVRQGHKPLGTLIRQGFDQHAVDDAEDRSGRANTQCQRKNARRREPRLAAQPANGITQIGKPRLYRVLPPVLAYLFANGRFITYLHPRRSPGFIGREPSGGKHGRAFFQVMVDFFSDLLVRRPPVSEHPYAAGDLTPDRHGLSLRLQKTRDRRC